MPLRIFSCLTALVCLASVVMASEPNSDPFPQTKTIKGLQVQMIPDALELGVEHATLNVDLTTFIDPTGTMNGPTYEMNGRTFHFRPAAVQHLDERVKPLSDKDVVVYLILLTYVSGDPKYDDIMIHPDYARGEPHAGPIGMLNTSNPESTAWLDACMEFIADRYSSDKGFGRVWGYISGNEINSHWFWANMGHVAPDVVISAYENATRHIHTAVRKYSANARVYLSMDHCWKDRYVVASEKQAMGGREFLERFADKARERGDFDWHLAYHPYPEPLTDPRFWLDHTHSPHHLDAPTITFRNLDVLTEFLESERFLYNGQPRRVILSEQGFHCVESRPTGEEEQAAAYALAYKKVSTLPVIDAFILHRHTDHAEEGGLNLGLWTNKPGQICSPDRKRQMYDVFLHAGTDKEDAAFEFALKTLKVNNWNEALEDLMTDPPTARSSAE